MIQARRDHKLIVYIKNFFVFGGCKYNNETITKVEMYLPDTNKLIMMAAMKISRKSFARCRIRNLVYIIGGNFNYVGTNSVKNLQSRH